MAKKPTNRRKKGTFKKGKSGNPYGRPKGTTNHDNELRQAEEWAMELAANACDVFMETVKAAFKGSGNQRLQRLIPVIETIAGEVKEEVREGEIGPSKIAILRSWYDNHCEYWDGEFFLHIGLPKDCSWETYRIHYTTRNRVDSERAAEELMTFPPVAARYKELQEEMAA